MTRFHFLLIFCFFATECGHQYRQNRKDISLDETPELTGILPYENFESYRGVLTQTPWPSEGGWQVSPYGNIVDAGVDRIVKYEGNYSLRMTYRMGESDMIGLSRLYSPCLKWKDYDAVRLWLRPDGSGRNFTFFVMTKIREDGIKWFYESAYPMSGTEPVILTIPFSSFYLENNTKGKDARKDFDWSEIEETCFWVRRGKGERNPQVPSTIWVDDVKIVKLAQPLDKVVSEPVNQTLPARNDRAIRIDYGSEADWIDAAGRQWRADIPAREGRLAVSPNMPVAGTSLPDLYRNERRGIKKLSIPVSSGHYLVALHFAETDPANASAGRRMFSVDVEGHVIHDIDLWSRTGGLYIAHIELVPVEVKDAELTLIFTAKRGMSAIAALEVLPPGTPPAGSISWQRGSHISLKQKDLQESNMIEDFESYRDDSSLCMVTRTVMGGMPPTLALDPGSRCDGMNGLRFDYVFGRQKYCGFLWQRKIPVKGYRGLRFWIRPDGSGNRLRVFSGTGKSSSFALNLNDINPRVVEFPWDDFFDGKPLPESLSSLGIEVDQNGTSLYGTLYFDRFELME
jgi:hypothetical protein